MDFTQLQYFRTVARLQNVTRAAEILYISQPNLSTSLTKLENELGIQLFYRKKGSITLTPKGELFLSYVERALQELDSGMAAITNRSTVVARRTDVASSIAGLLPRLIKKFAAGSEPPPFIHINRCSEEIYRLLDEGRLDFAISTLPGNGLDMRWLPMREDLVVALMGPDHPLAGAESLPLEALSETRLVCNDLFLEKEAVDDLCIKAGFFPNIILQSNEVLTERTLLPLRDGAVLAMSHMLPLVMDLYSDAVRVVPLSGTYSTVTIGLSIKKSRLLSEQAKAFFDFTAEQLPGLIAETSLLK